jgi:acyl dehydratase
LGLVHLSNQIRQVRPIKKGEKLSLSCCFDQLALHPKGWSFSVKVQFYSGTELVWQSISTNLFRTNHGYVTDTSAKYSAGTFTNPIIKTRKLSSNLGRRYAKVSGDFNPIHLSKWSAKLFDFKQHIIHGMWTKSYCISVLQKINPLLFVQAFAINTTFKQPLYLPNQINVAVQPLEPDSSDDKQHFKVVGIKVNNEQ